MDDPTHGENATRTFDDRHNGAQRNKSRDTRDTKRTQSAKPYRRGGIVLRGFEDERPRTLAEKAGDAWKAFQGKK